MAKINSKVYESLLKQELAKQFDGIHGGTFAVDPASGPDKSVLTLQYMRDAYKKLRAHADAQAPKLQYILPEPFVNQFPDYAAKLVAEGKAFYSQKLVGKGLGTIVWDEIPPAEWYKEDCDKPQTKKRKPRPMTKYTGTKTVTAFKIERIEAVDYGMTYELYGEGGFLAIVGDAYCKKHEPQVGGYYVQYEDGYESFSPAKAFEAAYKLSAPSGVFAAASVFTDQELKDDPILRYFHYSHLPPMLQTTSKPFCDVAKNIIQTIPRSAERTAGLRKLLEAKDCIVRANI